MKGKPCDIPAPKLAYTVPEAACLISISRSRLYESIMEGRGPEVTKVGARTLITHNALEAWLLKANIQRTAA